MRNLLPEMTGEVHHSFPQSPSEASLTSLSVSTTTTDEEYPVTIEAKAKTPSNIPLLVTAFLSSLVSGGTVYAFSIFASPLKHNLNLTQSELDTISSAQFCAGILSWIPGMVVDRYGPRISAGMGGMCMSGFLLMYYLVSTQRLVFSSSSSHSSDLALDGDEQAHDHQRLVLTLSLLGIGTFVSSALITGSVFKMIVGSCPTGTRGKAVGVAKGFVGFGSGFYATLWGFVKVVANNNSDGMETDEEKETADLGFLLMAAVFAVGAVAVPALLLVPRNVMELLEGGDDSSKQPLGKKAEVTKRVHDGMTDTHFRTTYIGLMVLGSVVVGTSIIELLNENKDDETSDGQSWSSTSVAWNSFMSVLLFILWLGPLISLLFISPKKRKNGRKYSAIEISTYPDNDDQYQADGDEDDYNYDDEVDTNIVIHNTESIVLSSAKAVVDVTNSNNFFDDVVDVNTDKNQLLPHEHTQPSPRTTPPLPQNYNLSEMLRTPTAWVLAYTFTIITGGGTLITNNIAQMVESLDLPTQTASISLTFFSAAQATSRCTTGILSEYALQQHQLGREWFLVLASVVSFLGHGMLSIASHQIVFVLGVTIVGIGFGMIWPIMVLFVGEVFGSRNVGANYMFYDGFTSAIGTLVLSKFVAQSIYENHIDKSSHGDDYGFEDDRINTNETVPVSPERDELMDERDGSKDQIDDLTCFGMACFRQTHTIVAMLCLTCVVSSLLIKYLMKRQQAQHTIASPQQKTPSIPQVIK